MCREIQENRPCRTHLPGYLLDSQHGSYRNNFDFKEALRSIHIDLKGLNEEAVALAERIAKDFEELGA